MEPNTNFDNQETMNETINEAVAVTPRVVVISETQLAAFRTQYSRQQIADYYGISSPEVYKAMVDFGMVEPKTKSTTPEYVIELVRDMVKIPLAPVSTEA